MRREREREWIDELCPFIVDILQYYGTTYLEFSQQRCVVRHDIIQDEGIMYIIQDEGMMYIIQDVVIMYIIQDEQNGKGVDNS